MQHYATKLLLSLLFSFAAELLHAIYTKSLISGVMLIAALLSFILPFAGFFSGIWFIEEKVMAKRFWLVAATAAGYALGTVLVMCFW